MVDLTVLLGTPESNHVAVLAGCGPNFREISKVVHTGTPFDIANIFTSIVRQAIGPELLKASHISVQPRSTPLDASGVERSTMVHEISKVMSQLRSAVLASMQIFSSRPCRARDCQMGRRTHIRPDHARMPDPQ